MADDTCITVIYDDPPGKTLTYCWESTQIEPTWDSSKVDMGLRKGQSSGGRAWKTCQYYLNGLPARCKWWKEGSITSSGTISTTSGTYGCHYQVENTEILNKDDSELTEEEKIQLGEISEAEGQLKDAAGNPYIPEPTGYNGAACDFLGRRSWCNKYEDAGKEEPTYICAAPNPYLTGVAKRAAGLEAPIVTSVTREEILGYNDDGEGVGLCDCYGMGRGAPGCTAVGNVTEGGDSDIEKELVKLPVQCNYYRPFQMGFGALQPHEMRREYKDGQYRIVPGEIERLYDKVLTDDGFETRLPLSFELFNHRAKFQKCQWYDSDTGSDFIIYNGDIILEEEATSDAFDAAGKLIKCKCTDSESDPYRYRAVETGDPLPPISFMMDNVWAKGQTIVCNGAKPECPCYSGKWIYCTDERMLAGMPVSAEQIMELRFWSADWDSQEQYDEFFSQRPNRSDPSTPAIQTFDGWSPIQDAFTTSENRMTGKEVSLCQPVPFQLKYFDPELHLIKEDVIYQPPYTEMGTSVEGEQLHFPSLVRNPDFSNMRPLFVLYPYYNDSVFDILPCEEQGEAGHIKRHNTVYGDSVTAVGYTERGKKVYVLNANHITVPSLFETSFGLYDIDDEFNDYANRRIARLVREALQNQHEYVAQGTSDSTLGYFVIDPVKIDYNTRNKLFICVDFGDGTWEYRYRYVDSLWCGGLLLQSAFTHEYPETDEGYENALPYYFDPDASMQGKLIPLGGAINAGIKIANSYDVPTAFTPYTSYSYSIRKIEVTETVVLSWTALGNTNLVWAELADLNLNYIYEWGIDRAEMMPITETEEDGTEEPKREGAVPVEMEKVDIEQDTIPPHACLLKPKDDIRVRFSPEEWYLEIDYYYMEFTNENDTENEIVEGANKNSLSRYGAPSYSVSTEDLNVVITGIMNHTVALMGEFFDTDGRLISTFATHFMPYITRVGSRAVDIFYKYSAKGSRWVLEPSAGFCINPDRDRRLEGYREIWETPPCGDHEVHPISYIGPMWYPYSRCKQYNMYNEFTFANLCYTTYVGPENEGYLGYDKVLGVVYRQDYRYCGPYKYDAWAEVRAALQACGCGWIFYYADASDAQVIFRGYARRRGPVNVPYYEANGWALPPFGNEGCEFVERYFSKEMWNHYTSTGEVKNEWVPFVMDQTMFFLEFDSYESTTENEDYASGAFGIDSFNHVNQLNFVRSSDINETVDSGRYRFEDIFEIRYEGNCTYPLPERDQEVTFYTFKEDDLAWAWQEYWKPIERNVENEDFPTEKLTFIDSYEKPKYIYDIYKEEYRRILDEGAHSVNFTAPEFDEETNEMTKYPTVQIDDGPPRFFKLIYGSQEAGLWQYSASAYNDDQIEWYDDGGDANVDGSSGEDNVYEVADPDTDSDWLHDTNTVFDADVVEGTKAEAESGERAPVVATDLITGDPVKGYFHRGLIFNIPKSRLDYLPKTTKSMEFVSSSEGFVFQSEDEEQYKANVTDISSYINAAKFEATYVWGPSNNVVITVSGTSSVKLEKAVSRLYAKFRVGKSHDTTTNTTSRACYPGISMSIKCTDGDTDFTPRGFPTYLEPAYPDQLLAEGQLQNIEEYILDFYFSTGPIEMIYKKAEEITITLENVSECYIALDDLILYYDEYKDAREDIITWERKYTVSRMSSAINLDGPEDLLKYNKDLQLSGQYFRFGGRTYEPDGTVQAIDKMRAAFTGPYYEDDVSVPDVSYDNLKHIEANEQKDLYVQAETYDNIGDVLVFYQQTPARLDYFLESIDNLNQLYTNPDLVVKAFKLSWNNLYQTKQFVQYDFWRPGGHFYRWSTNFSLERCYVFGSTEKVYSGHYEHVEHYGQGTPISGPTTPVDPADSYYSLRFYAQQAKYDRYLILSGQPPEGGFDLVVQANPFN